MTEAKKSLLLKDLCARLPYGTLVFIRKPFGCVMSEIEEEELTTTILQEFIENDDVYVFPYLRPKSSMTEEEKMEYLTLTRLQYNENEEPYREITIESIDWLNAHHFDYRGLIEKRLALEAPEGIYKD